MTVGRWVGEFSDVVGCKVFTLEDGDADAIFLEKVGAFLFVAVIFSRLYGSAWVVLVCKSCAEGAT